MKKTISFSILLFALVIASEFCWAEIKAYHYYAGISNRKEFYHLFFVLLFLGCNIWLCSLLYHQESRICTHIASAIICIVLVISIILVIDKYYRVSGMPFGEFYLTGAVYRDLYLECLLVPLLYINSRRLIEEKTEWGKMGLIDSSILIIAFAVVVFIVSQLW